MGGAAFTAHSPDENLYRHSPKLLDGLLHRGKRRVYILRHGYAVETNDRHISGNREAHLA